jgi:hypothetical protein
LAECDLLLLKWVSSKIKIRASPAFHTQYSIVPPFHHSKDYLTANTTPTGEKSKPGSWGQDSLLRREIADEL